MRLEPSMKTRALTHALFLFAAITIGSSAPQSANATSMVPLTHSQLVDAADYIVRGKVVEVWAEQAADGTVWTRAQVDISHTFKGKNRSHLVVDQMGGTWGESATLVHGGARFSVGERVILFAEALGNGRIVSVGMQQVNTRCAWTPTAKRPSFSDSLQARKQPTTTVSFHCPPKRTGSL
jgi:hypothetical protein